MRVWPCRFSWIYFSLSLHQNSFLYTDSCGLMQCKNFSIEDWELKTQSFLVRNLRSLRLVHCPRRDLWTNQPDNEVHRLVGAWTLREHSFPWATHMYLYIYLGVQPRLWLPFHEGFMGSLQGSDCIKYINIFINSSANTNLGLCYFTSRENQE